MDEALSILLWDPVDIVHWIFILLWDPTDLGSLKCFFLSWDPGDLESSGSWILDFCFIVGSLRSWIFLFLFLRWDPGDPGSQIFVWSWDSEDLGSWLSDFAMGSCRFWILTLCFVAGSCGSWILIFGRGTCLLIRSFYRLYMPKFRRESKLQLWRSDRPRRIATNYGEKWDFFETCWMALLLPVGLVRAYDPGNRFVTSIPAS